MATNYVYIDLSTTLPASGLIRVQDADASDWSAYGQTVTVGISAPTGSYTHYRLWGYSGVISEPATWTSIPGGGTVDVDLDIGEEGIQYLYARFAESDIGANESLAITASGISYTWVEPTKQENLSWVALNDNYDLSNTLRSVGDSCDMTFTDANFKHLQFHGRDFSGIQMRSDKITVTSGSQIWKLVEYDDGAYVEIEKTFPTDDRPMITIEVDGEHVALTTYSGTAKAGLSSEDAARLVNYTWTPGTKNLTFDITKFSEYGFTTLDDISYAGDSTNAGYNGNSISLKVRVTDTNGEGVESAPVTFSGIAGDTIGNLSANTVYTNATGYATATLNLTAEGSATYRATVDALTADQITTCYAVPTSLQRSLLTQYEQIRRSGTYTPTVSGVNTQAVAEPSGSTDDAGSDDVLEHDMNVFRTLIDQMRGGTDDWYDTMPTYEDPTATDVPKSVTFNNIKENTLDAKTIINAIEATNSGLGFDISVGNTGWLYDTNVGYAEAIGNKLGLCIFASTTNSGSWYDEGGIDEVCSVDLIDTSTGAEFTVSGTSDIIYAKLHDGEDEAGVGNNYDVYVRFYVDDAPYAWTSSDPVNITMIFPYRRRLSDMEEHQWMRTDFVSRFEGDAELVDDMVNLWSYTGGGDDVVGPSWTDTGNYYMIGASDNLTVATDNINTKFGSRVYPGTYLTSDETITASLNALDAQVKLNFDDIGFSSGLKLVEALVGDINAGVEHSIPAGQNYTPDDTGGKEGQNLDIYFNGQLLAASTGPAGNQEDRDYAETSTSGVTFHENVYQDDNITYVIRL